MQELIKLLPPRQEIMDIPDGENGEEIEQCHLIELDESEAGTSTLIYVLNDFNPVGCFSLHVVG